MTMSVVLPFAVAAIALFVVAAVRWPDLAVAAMAITVFTNASDVLGRNAGTPGLGDPLLSLLIAGFIYRHWRARITRSTLLAPPPAFAMVAFGWVTLSLGSALWAADPVRSVARAQSLVRDATIAVAIMFVVRTCQSLRRAIWAVVVAGGLIAGLSVFQYATHRFGTNFGGFGRATVENIAGTTDGYRLSGPYDDPNFYGLILLLVVPLAADRFLHERDALLRLAALVSVGLVALAIVFTFSRGAFVGLVIAVLGILVRERPRPAVLAAIALGGLLVASQLPSNYTNRLSALSDALPGSDVGRAGADVSIRGRTSEVRVAIEMFADHPILGVGAANYPFRYQAYARAIGLDGRREEREPHSLYGEAAAELGLVGLAALGAMLVLTRRRLRIAARGLAAEPMYASIPGAIGTAFAGYLSASIFLHAQYARPAWVLLGLAWAASYLKAAAPAVDTARLPSFRDRIAT